MMTLAEQLKSKGIHQGISKSIRIKAFTCIFYTASLLFNIIAVQNAMADQQYPAYQIIWDKYYSPTTYAKFSKSLINAYEQIYPYTNNNSILHTLIDIPLMYYIVLIGHEVNGHGFRLREFGDPNITYHIGFFEGYAMSSQKLPSTQHSLLVSLSGIEASDIMARDISMSYLQSKKIKPAQAWLFIFSSGNQSYYIHMFDDRGVDGHDIKKIVENLNTMYGKNTISMSTYRQLGIIDYLDPFLYYSFYSISNYLANGQDNFEYPMINIDQVKWLPGLRLISTPFGPEKQIVNYLRYENNEYNINSQVTINYGETAGHKSYGIGINIAPIRINKNTSIGARFIFWNQPEIFTKDPTNASNKTGILASLTTIFGEDNISFISEVGYKTKGYVPGEVINAALVLRIGVQFLV